MHPSSCPTTIFLLLASIRLAVAVPPPTTMEPVPTDVVNINISPPAESTADYVAPPLTIVPQEDTLPPTSVVEVVLPAVSTVFGEEESMSMAVVMMEEKYTSYAEALPTPPSEEYTITTTTMPPHEANLEPTSTTTILKNDADEHLTCVFAWSYSDGDTVTEKNGTSKPVETSGGEGRARDGRNVWGLMAAALVGVMGAFVLA